MTIQQKVDKSQWRSQAIDMKQRGLVRCEWLTATHNGGDSFEISLMLSNEDLTESFILSTDIDASLESLIEIYPSVDFHEREVAQMFGVDFIGNNNSAPAFEIELMGFPLRRDFVLATRADTQWPGAVEPDETAKRRPSLPPGVLPEWTA
jgi:NADH-quinone oxidoreductase subunit C